MDIPALSMAMSQTQLQTDVGIAMLSKSIDLSQSMGADIAKMMEQSAAPHLGTTIDVLL